MLLEILIGLALMSILFSFLFTSMTRSAQFENKIETARASLIERQKLQTRLQDIFLTLQDGSLYTKRIAKEKKESLMAIFDHGIDPDPAFSGPVLARIYLDPDHNLSLALWPLGKEGDNLPWRNEVLLSHVDDFQFQFLGKKTEPSAAPVNAQLAWYDIWPQKRAETPTIARLTIRQGDVSLSYAFFFSNPEPLVTYWEGGYRQ